MSIKELPDELLVDILSRLKTKEAAGTCSLVSRRWRNLWKSCWNLNLDFRNLRHNEEHTRKCMDYVYNYWMQQKGEMDHMRVAFRDNKGVFDHRTLQTWLELSNVKRAVNVTIDLKAPMALTIKPLHRCVPLEIETWDRLTALTLKSVKINQDDVVLMLSKSPSLETLLLDNVPISRLDFKECPLLKLKRLEIRNCAILESIIAESSAPVLESYKHVQRKDSKPMFNGPYFKHAPKLVDICLEGPLCKDHIRSFVYNDIHLQKLQLDIDVDAKCTKKNCAASSMPYFKHLKEPELRFTCIQKDDLDKNKMDKVFEFMRSTPCLEKLTLKYEILKTLGARDDDDVCYDDDDVSIDVDDEYYCGNVNANKCLKEVRVEGWSGLKSEVRFIRYLIHTSPNLYRTVLDPTPMPKLKRRFIRYLIHTSPNLYRTVLDPTPMPKLKRERELAARVAQKLITYKPYEQDNY